MAEITLAIEAVHKLGFIHRYVFSIDFKTHTLTLAVTSNRTTSFSTAAATSS
jgi:hypothetical protein